VCEIQLIKMHGETVKCVFYNLILKNSRIAQIFQKFYAPEA